MAENSLVAEKRRAEATLELAQTELNKASARIEQQRMQIATLHGRGTALRLSSEEASLRGQTWDIADVRRFTATSKGPPDFTNDALREMLERGVGLTSLLLGGNPLESALRAAGFSAEALRKVGFAAAGLRTGGFGSEELKACGFTAKQLKAGGFTAQELSDGGFPANQLKLVGFTDTELLAVGFTPQELKSKLGLEGVAAVRKIDLSVSLPMTWE